MRWWLYHLKRSGIIENVGYGKYRIGNKGETIKFTLSKYQKRIDLQIRRTFPQINFCQWSTSWLHQFMRHQPANFLNIIEVEREVCESVFNVVQEKKAKIYFMPNSEMLNHTVFNSFEPSVVVPLVSESPLDKTSEWNIPRIEKIIIDLIAKKDIFLFYQGQELKNIIFEIDKKYMLNDNMMVRYAKRRNKLSQLQTYLKRLK